MDDLAILRDLGRDLEHPPPASLGHQRLRLLDTAAGARVERRRTWGVLRGWPMLALVGTITAALILAPVMLLRDDRSASRPATGGPGAGERPALAGKPINMLLIGSDERGDVAKYGARSDTLILVRLSADRKTVSGLSIPRDLMVRLPACEKVEGGTAPGGTALINSAFTLGGPACTAKTIESVTRIPIDHTVTVKFAGFKKIVDLLGGVEVTLPRDVDDPAAGLRLSAGQHLLSGDQALAYVRVRRGIGDGSDLSRIKRQQQFLVSVAAKAKRELRDPRKVAEFVKAVKAAVVTDDGLDLKSMLSIAQSLGRTPAGAVRFTTVPARTHPTDPNRLVLDQARAEQLFARYRTR